MNNNTTTAPALSTIAPQIAAALPGKWVASPVSKDRTESNFFLTREDGLQLFLADYRGGWAARGRLFIQHSRPRQNGQWLHLYEKGVAGPIKSPEITVAETKSPEKIAADIVSRLLAESERVHGLALAEINRETIAKNEKNDMARDIALAIGAEMERGHDGEPRSRFYYRNVSMRVNTGESVTFEFSANRAQSLALIAFMDSPAYRELSKE